MNESALEALRDWVRAEISCQQAVSERSFEIQRENADFLFKVLKDCFELDGSLK